MTWRGFPLLWTGLHFCFWLINERRGCVCVWPQIYTDWANHYLAKSGHKRLIKDLQTDVTDGVLLAEIIQVVGKEKSHSIPKICKRKTALIMWLLEKNVNMSLVTLKTWLTFTEHMNEITSFSFARQSWFYRLKPFNSIISCKTVNFWVMQWVYLLVHSWIDLFCSVLVQSGQNAIILEISNFSVFALKLMSELEEVRCLLSSKTFSLWNKEKHACGHI